MWVVVCRCVCECEGCVGVGVCGVRGVWVVVCGVRGVWCVRVCECGCVSVVVWVCRGV